MLRASYSYLPKAPHGTRPSRLAYEGEQIKVRRLSELRELVDRFCKMSTDRKGRFPHRASGDHAWISVINNGMVLHAYFSAREIRFEYFGGTKDVGVVPWGGLIGRIGPMSLIEALRLMSASQSPRQYLLANAIQVRVDED